MNNDFLNHSTPEEQAAAQKLLAMAEEMQVSRAFQAKLEAQLLQAHRGRSRDERSWRQKMLPSLGWAVLAICTLLLLSWSVRTLIPGRQPTLPAAMPAATEILASSTPTSTPAPSAPTSTAAAILPPAPTSTVAVVENVCTGRLAGIHGFSAFLTNSDRTGFKVLDEQSEIGELRSFAWSPDGQQLAIVGNTRGSGNIYLLAPDSDQLQPVISNSELGYLMGVAWSHSGEQLLTWDIRNNTAVYFVAKDGSGLDKRDLPLQLFETPQYSPDDASILFYGADQTTSGLFEVELSTLQARLVSPLVEDETSFAWSPDGSRLAYMEMDRVSGKARLIVENQQAKDVIAELPIPARSGSAIPSAANLSWAPDGQALVFAFGMSLPEVPIYLANADGSGLTKVTELGRAPSISADGKCLAYIRDDQVFLLDLTGTLSTPTFPAPGNFFADLPAARGAADIKLDYLQWQLGATR